MTYMHLKGLRTTISVLSRQLIDGFCLKQILRDQSRTASSRRISENSFFSEDLDVGSGERSRNASGW